MKRSFFTLIATSIFFGNTALATRSVEKNHLDEKSHLEQLNKHLVRKILQYVPMKKLLLFSSTNKRLRQIAINEMLERKNQKQVFEGDTNKNLKHFESCMNSFVMLNQKNDKKYFANIEIRNIKAENLIKVFNLLNLHKDYISYLDIGKRQDRSYNHLGLLSTTDQCLQELKSFLKQNNTITSLGFSDRDFSIQGLILLKNQLSINKNRLKSLNLSGANVDLNKLKIIKQILEINPITHFYLANNYLEAEGIKMVLDVSKNSSLTYLDLSDTFYGEAETIKESLEQSKLSGLNLSKNNIDGKNAITIIEALQKNSLLTSLDLSQNPIFLDKNLSSDIITSLKQSHIVDLNLSNTHISETGEEILDLFQDSRIQKLNLRQNNISAEGIRNILQHIKNSDINVIHFYSSNGFEEPRSANEDGILYSNKILYNLDLTMKKWQKKEPDAFYFFMKNQNLNPEMILPYYDKFLYASYTEEVEKSIKTFLSILNHAWNEFLKKKNLLKKEGSFNPFDFYYTHMSLAYAFKQKGIKIDFTDS